MTGPHTTPALLIAGDIHPNPGPTAKYPCPVYARDVTSRGVSYRCTRCTGWVHAKCSGLLNAAQYRRNKDWTCDSCSASKTQQPTPPPPSPSPTPAPSADQISDDSTLAPNDTAYKRWSCHSGFKLLCKLCRTSPPPALGARFTVFWPCRPCGPAGWLALLLTKAGDVETNPGPTTSNKKVWI